MATQLSAQNNKFSFEIVKEMQLQLDNETAYPWALGSTFQYCEDTEEIVYLNRITQTLKYYDYKTGKQTRETKLQLMGPDDVGKAPYYAHYHSRDSIFIIAEGNGFNLSLIDSKGTKINTYDYGSNLYEDYQYTPIPKASTIFGAIEVVDNYLYLAVRIPSIKKQLSVAPIIKLNLNTKEVKYLKYPIPYEEIDLDRLANPQSREFYSTRVTYNKNTKKLIVNYPLEHDFYVVDDNGAQSIKGKSPIIGDFVFLKKDRNEYSRNHFDLKSQINTSAWYFGIMYDPYKDLYYRIGRIEGDRSLYRRKQAGQDVKIPYTYSLSVFDADFKLLADRTITTAGGIFHRGSFIEPDGLWVAQLNVNGEDVMGFNLLSLVKKSDEK
jgi:CRISPR/Cas system CMR-associated protein Cmr5 small subunit